MLAKKEKILDLVLIRPCDDAALSMPPPAFQVPYIVKLDWIGFVKQGIGLLKRTWYISKTSLKAGRLGLFISQI